MTNVPVTHYGVPVTTASIASKVNCVKLVYNNTGAQPMPEKTPSALDNNFMLVSVNGANLNKTLSGYNRPILPTTQHSSSQVIVSQTNVMIVPRCRDSMVTETFNLKPVLSNPQVIMKSQVVTSIRPMSNIPIAPSTLKGITVTTPSASKVQCVKLIYSNPNTQAKPQKRLSAIDNNLLLVSMNGSNINKATPGNNRPILPTTQQPSRQQPVVLSKGNLMIVPQYGDSHTTENQDLNPMGSEPQYILSPQIQSSTESADSRHLIPIRAESGLSKSSHCSQEGTTKPRKPCNCTKSQCLKLYCDCFTNGEFCNNCNCTNCSNNLKHEAERQRAIKACLERNPFAFHPKIGKGGEGEMIRQHNKGCNCKRSGCLKNYCECYEAKILCSSLCKCVGCKNFEESPERKTLMHLADAAEVRVQQQIAATSKLTSHIDMLATRPLPFAMSKR